MGETGKATYAVTDAPDPASDPFPTGDPEYTPAARRRTASSVRDGRRIVRDNPLRQRGKAIGADRAAGRPIGVESPASNAFPPEMRPQPRVWELRRNKTKEQIVSGGQTAACRRFRQEPAPRRTLPHIPGSPAPPISYPCARSPKSKTNGESSQNRSRPRIGTAPVLRSVGPRLSLQILRHGTARRGKVQGKRTLQRKIPKNFPAHFPGSRQQRRRKHFAVERRDADNRYDPVVRNPLAG